LIKGDLGPKRVVNDKYSCIRPITPILVLRKFLVLARKFRSMSNKSFYLALRPAELMWFIFTTRQRVKVMGRFSNATIVNTHGVK